MVPMVSSRERNLVSKPIMYLALYQILSIFCLKFSVREQSLFSKGRTEFHVESLRTIYILSCRKKKILDPI